MYDLWCMLRSMSKCHKNNKFVGAQAISQVRLFDLHPTGSMTKDERLDALMSAGGLQECGNSQNCVNACPKGIPLTTSIAAMNRELLSICLNHSLVLTTK